MIVRGKADLYAVYTHQITFLALIAINPLWGLFILIEFRLEESMMLVM